MKTQRFRSAGFTILEMALSLFAIGFLMSAVPRLLSQGSATMAAAPGSQPLEAAELALKAFVLKNNRLPCPAASGVSGTEDCSKGEGYVPWTLLGLARPATNTDGHALAYAVLRNASGSNDLAAPVLTSNYTPTYLNTPDDAGSRTYGDAATYTATPATASSDQKNGLDFCAKLRAQAALSALWALSNDSSLLSVLSVRDWKTPYTAQTNAAWVLVDPGSSDPAFNGYNNPASSRAFESPGRPLAPDYDDKVVVGTLTQMFSELRCPSLLASVSAAAREADFANDNWRVRKYLLDFRNYELDVRKQKKTQADNFKLLAIFDISLTVALGALDLGIALAGPAGAIEIAVSVVNAVASISMSAYNYTQADASVTDAGNEVTEGTARVTAASTAVTNAGTFRTARQNALLLLDQRGWFQ